MRNKTVGMKKYCLVLFAFLPILSFAAWSQPSSPAPAGNTQPPINVGNVQQIKGSMIGATKFCIYMPDRVTEVSCLGANSTNNALNTTRFCLGNDCISNWDELKTAVTNVVWQSIINENGVSKITGGNGIDVSPAVGKGDVVVRLSNKPDPTEPACTNGQVLKYDALNSKWRCGQNGATNTDTLDVVLQREFLPATAKNVKFYGTVGIGYLQAVKVDVGGDLKIRGGTPGPNKVLVSIDDEGNAEWRSLDEIMGCRPNCNCAANTTIGFNCTNSCGTGQCAGTKAITPACVPNCNCAASTNIGSKCTNSCGTGQCEGTKIVVPACVPNCNCSASTNVGSKCTNSCGTGQCEGTKIVIPACVPNCNCAASTNIGSTCTNSCGTGTCAGTKCVPNCNCAASTNIGSKCTNSCGTGQCEGTKCVPNCNCASRTNIGSTCTNSCGTGTCAGTKCVPNCNCAITTNRGSTCTNSCGTGQCSGIK